MCDIQKSVLRDDLLALEAFFSKRRFRFSSEKDLQDAIEPRIRPLVEDLNTFGFRTHYSCGGHFFRDRQAWVVFESDIETAYRLWIFLGNGKTNLKLFWSVKPWPGISARTFMLLSGNYMSWRTFTRHLPSDIKELTKSLGILRHHENSQQYKEQSNQNMSPAIDPGPAGILRPTSETSDGIGCHNFSASITDHKSFHSNPSFQKYHAFLQKTAGGIVCPLSEIEEIHQIVKSLNRLSLEETITTIPEINASFLPGRKIWLRIGRLNEGENS